MKKYLILIIISVFCWIGVHAQSQVSNMSDALNGTTVQSMTKYFDDLVNITIDDVQSTYSKAQAEQVVKSFCGKNGIKKFIRTNAGPRTETSFFILGEVNGTGRNRFKVFLYFKQKGKTSILQQMKFDPLKGKQ